MTGRPSNGWSEGTTHVAPSPPELARLRTFCLLNAILYLCTSALTAALRLLLANLVDEGRVQLPVPLVRAGTALRGVAGRARYGAAVGSRGDHPGSGWAGSGGSGWRTARVVVLLVAAICVTGLVVVLRLSIADTVLPTVAVTGIVIVFALYTYAGMAKLPR